LTEPVGVTAVGTGNLEGHGTWRVEGEIV
jgi:hypothetical protein